MTITSAGGPKDWSRPPDEPGEEMLDLRATLAVGRDRYDVGAALPVRFQAPCRARKIAPWYLAGNILPV